MTSENIFEGVSFIESGFIDSSAAVLKRRRSERRADIAQRAACIAAAVVLVFGGLMIAYNAVRSGLTGDSGVPPVVIAEIDGAGYCMEGFHTGDIRRAYGLPEPTVELKGEFIGSYYAGYEGTEEYDRVDFYTVNIDTELDVLLGEYKGRLCYWVKGYDKGETKE